MRVNLTTQLPCSYEQAIVEVNTPRLLEYVAYPVVSFKPIEPASFPKTWVEGTYWVDMKLFSFLSLGRQAIVITHPATEETFMLRDSGHSAMIKTWDHTITIERTGSGILYRDEVIISAGIFTPLIWLFAMLFYGHRQRRWKLLASRGFDYGTS